MTLLDIKQAIDDIDLTRLRPPSLVTSAIGTQLILVADEMGEKFEIEIDVEDDDLVDSTGAQSNAILTQLFGDNSTCRAPSRMWLLLANAARRDRRHFDAGRHSYTVQRDRKHLPGVDIELLKSNQAADPPTRMGVYVDQTELGAAGEFVDRYNNLLDSVEDSTYFGATANQSAQRAITWHALCVMNCKFAMKSPVRHQLGGIGVNYTQDGRLELDEAKLVTLLA